MKLYLPFSKAEKQDDGTIIVTGIASSETKDAQGEIVKADAMKAAIPDYMALGGTGALREMHQQIAAGIVLKAEVNEAGETHVEAKVVDANSVKKVEEGVFKGFSIGGKVLRKQGNCIEELMLKEISLVDRPANPDARLSIFKAEGIADTIEKSLYTTSRLANLLAELKCLAESENYEAAVAGEVSPVSPAIKAAVAALGAALQASVTHETTESEAEAQAEDVEMSDKSDDLKKGLEPIQKAISELGEDLRKALAASDEARKAEITKLSERIAVVEKTPAAPKAAVTTISKVEDNGGSEPISPADLAKALAELPEAERTRVMMKAALANPINAAA